MPAKQPADRKQTAKKVPKAQVLKITLKHQWRTLVVVLCPGVMAGYFIVFDWNRKDIRCLYVISISVVYWVCEALPFAVPAMFPIVVWPVLGVAHADITCRQYLTSNNVYMFCTFIIAIAFQYCNFHERLALNMLKHVGGSHRRLSFVFMLSSMTLSLWLSNAAACALMCSVATAAFERFERYGLARLYYYPEDAIVTKGPNKGKTVRRRLVPTRTACCYFLGIAYAATAGGIACPCGTGTNQNLVTLYRKSYPKAPPITFHIWLAFGFLPMLAITFFCWVCLNVQYMGLFCKGETDEEVRIQNLESKAQSTSMADSVRARAAQEHDHLGPWNCHQAGTAFVFFLLLVLIALKEPLAFPGWSDLIDARDMHGVRTEIDDCVPAVFCVILLFLIPAQRGALFCCHKDETKRSTTAPTPLLSWKVVLYNFPWTFLFLIGGGYALALGCKTSHLGHTLSKELQKMPASLSPHIVLLIFMAAALVLTEFISNQVLALMMIPFGFQMSMQYKIHPLFVTLPMTLCCSFSFMIPGGTPANIIVHSLVNIPIKDMMLAGMLPKIFSLAIVYGLWIGYGEFVMGATSFPDWAKHFVPP